jgi:RNA polymerase sigma-70 factor, ECF subfamily
MNIPLEDKVILDHIKEGNIAAFEKLFKENYPHLCCYAEDFLREKEAAEEVVSEFFLKLWENKKLLDIRQTLTGYLYASIRNNCIKYLEHLKVSQKYSEYAAFTLQNIDLLHPDMSYPLAGLISKEVITEVEEAIESLPPQCGIIFKLSRFEELSYEEIAIHLHISVNTVRTQMSRALQKLRESLKDYLPL